MSEAYDNSTRGTHLIALLYLSFAVSGVSLAAVIYRFPEAWMVPILIAGLLLSWYLHISKKFTAAQRLFVYAFVGWLCFLLDGVQPTSLYDISILAALEMLIYSKTDNRKLLHISLLIYFFCLGWQIKYLFVDGGTEAGTLIVSQIASHSFFLVLIYGISLAMMKKRQSDMKADEEEISALKNARRHMEDFLAGISHELRMPVNTAMGIASVVSKNAGNEKEAENAEMVLSAGKRLTNRLNDMLDYMEIETEKITVSEENYMISSVLNDLIMSMELYEQEALPDILFDVDASIPAVLKGDSRLIRKVLRHAVDNAVKFTKKGGVYVNVYADRRDYGINLSMDVEDTGRGMSRREMERIRTASYQADADRSRRTGGIGLGFPVMNGFVRMMNGFMTIRSGRRTGTSLHISIPQGVVDDTPCMDIAHPERIRVAFYQDPSKFDVPAVRDYYAKMILHIIQDFKLTMQRVSTEEDLKRLLEEQTFTHLFTADEEYSRNPELFESWCDRMHVIVVAKNTFVQPEHSNVTVLRKPLYAFPLLALLNAKTAQEARSLLTDKEEAAFPGARVLVVDDEEMNLMVAGEILSEYGVIADRAFSGAEAVRMVRENPYDAVLLDHMMPGMNGVECLKLIRGIRNDTGKAIPVIALTANALSTARAMFAEEGFDGFVAKPIDRTELTRVLKKVWGS